jgi:phosphonate transport system ATP-binding protein
MIKIKGLSKHFGTVKAVNNVDLTIPTGQMVGIIGSSGAGKSTLLRAINRLTESTSGSVYYNRKNITAMKENELLNWRSNCAMIFQQFNLVKRLSVITNVLSGRLRKHWTLPTLFFMFSKEERALAVRELDRVEILDQAFKRCDQLSGGQQQRVAIARAMMQQPKVLLADEPIASLDPRSATKVMETLQKINREMKITVILSLHHLASARQYCQRIVGMASGRIVFDGTPDELTEKIVRTIYSVEDAKEELEHDKENVNIGITKQDEKEKVDEELTVVCN